MQKDKNLTYYLLLIISIAAAYFIICIFSGIWPWDGNAYNTYTLQALSWLEGRLDLSMDYEHLEIAYYKDTFFVIFPPFPSAVMLPFALLFGENTPDHVICLMFAILGGIYAFRLGRNFKLEYDDALFWSIFLITGNNFLFVAMRGWVWFIAQTMSFTFTLMAFYYATCENEKYSCAALFWLCCAFGCRPFQILYTPLIIYLLYKRYSGSKKITKSLTRLVIWSLPAVALGVCYMLLNYFRFSNPFDFGRQYLPEVANSNYGEFNINYLKSNLRSLMALPYVLDGRLRFQKFNGTAFYIVIPMYISYLIYTVAGMIKGSKNDRIIISALMLIITLHIFLICSRITMGGWQFGNRYIVDALPAAYLGIVCLCDNFKGIRKFNYPLYIMGFGLNLAGTMYFYLDLL